MQEMKFKCTICKNEMVHLYNPKNPKHKKEFICGRCNYKFQKTIPGKEPNPAQQERILIINKYASHCRKCKKSLDAGNEVYWIPKIGVWCEACGGK